MSKPSAPPTLIYDHSSDPEEQLWDRLHERSQLAPELRVIVHLKSGTTLIGRLRYYDNFHLTVATEGQLRDVLYRDVAHILQASEPT
jgi:sRNA-binding regulator protein Hfq